MDTGREIMVTPPLPGAAPYQVMVVRRVVTAVGAIDNTNSPPNNGRQGSTTTSNGRGQVVDVLV
jgi:hypothetical protein